MDEHKPMSEFLTGLVGVAAIGLLVAAMLFGMVLLTGDSELAYTDAQQTAPHPSPTLPAPRTN